MCLLTSNDEIKINLSQVYPATSILIFPDVVEVATKKSHHLRNPHSVSRVDLKVTGK